jgi:hypothetical protein
VAGASAGGLAASPPQEGRQPEDEQREAWTALQDKALAAVSAGAIAAAVQATFSSVTEPVINRILMKRMTFREAVRDVRDANLLTFFSASLSSNLVKKPLFEFVVALAALLPSTTVTSQGMLIGALFATATLPITNFKFWMSLQMPLHEALRVNMLYKAYVPTLLRDGVYAAVRMTWPSLGCAGVAGPQLVFCSVFAGCLVSAPLNEVRGYLLQPEGKKLPFAEFFEPRGFLRSSIMGALSQAFSLSAGYWMSACVLSA